MPKLSFGKTYVDCFSAAEVARFIKDVYVGQQHLALLKHDASAAKQRALLKWFFPIRSSHGRVAHICRATALSLPTPSIFEIAIDKVGVPKSSGR